MTKGKKKLKLHLGCGDRHYKRFVNCDIRKTKATDQVFDCSNLKPFPDQSADVIFSHAFFEHLEPKKAYIFLQECLRVISDDGYVVILGIPDFDRIASAYLQQKKIKKNPNQVFDLYQVFRLTHGDSEGDGDQPIWQTHKNIFNKGLLFENVTRVGFKNCLIFNYVFKGEIIPLNIGVIATKKEVFNSDEIEKMMAPFSENIGDYNLFIKEINQAGLKK